jgi:hypothetical protein
MERLMDMMSGNSLMGKLATFVLKIVGASKRGRALVKLMIAESINATKGDFINSPSVDEESKKMFKILITYRNNLVINRLKILIKNGEYRTISVFYGGGHMYGIEKKILSELNYRPLNVKWLTVYRVAKADTGFSDIELKNFKDIVNKQFK